MKVVVTYESRSGNTQRAAQLIAGGLGDAGADVSIGRIGEVDFGTLASADLVIVGTWTGGLFFFGQHPGDGGRIANGLPDLWDIDTWSYVTYAHNPGKAADKLAEVLEAKGAHSLGSAAFHRNKLQAEVTAFVDEIIDHYSVA